MYRKKKTKQHRNRKRKNNIRKASEIKAKRTEPKKILYKIIVCRRAERWNRNINSGSKWQLVVSVEWLFSLFFRYLSPCFVCDSESLEMRATARPNRTSEERKWKKKTLFVLSFLISMLHSSHNFQMFRENQSIWSVPDFVRSERASEWKSNNKMRLKRSTRCDNKWWLCMWDLMFDNCDDCTILFVRGRTRSKRVENVRRRWLFK